MEDMVEAVEKEEEEVEIKRSCESIFKMDCNKRASVN